MRPTLYEFAGGEQAFAALAHAHHARCLADPELNHPFTRRDLEHLLIDSTIVRAHACAAGAQKNTASRV